MIGTAQRRGRSADRRRPRPGRTGPSAIRPAGHPAVSTATATGKSGTTADDPAAWYAGTAPSVSTAVVVHRMDLATSLEPLPLNGIAGTPADSVPYAVRSGAMGLG
ncbi:hypothetical protein [Streptomyces sp. NRRL S-646]|uniref:hypothetical protein n=1 Tax=Streptomyces sp. NRRL S-646 TaxID=1463917 RepID=UPI0004C6E66D